VGKLRTIGGFPNSGRYVEKSGRPARGCIMSEVRVLEEAGSSMFGVLELGRGAGFWGRVGGVELSERPRVGKAEGGDAGTST